jgi:putative SOS response-associated peptidase YedK
LQKKQAEYVRKRIYIHHRMPAIILRNQVKEYFNNPAEKNLDLCTPYPAEDMGMEKVGL